MGTRVSTETRSGKSMNDAFNEAYHDAEDEHGHEQGYSGYINCTRLSRDVTREYKAASDKRKFVDDLHDRMESGSCYGVELEPPKQNTNKVKTQVTVTPQKGAKQWETRYVVEPNWEHREIASEKTQGVAIKMARAYAEKHETTCKIYIQKIMIKGNPKVAEVAYKPSKTQKNGKYLFIYAAKD